MAADLTALLAADPTRKAIFDTLQGLDASFHVEPYLRVAGHRADAMEIYIDDAIKALDIFMISFVGMTEGVAAYSGGTMTHARFPYLYGIHYFRALKDSDATEIVFGTRIKSVIQGLAADTTLGGVVSNSEVISVDEVQFTQLGSITSHRADMLLRVHEQVGG